MKNKNDNDEIKRKEHTGEYAPKWKKEEGFEDIPDSELWRFIDPLADCNDND